MNKKIKYDYDVSFYINEIGNYTLDIYSNTKKYKYSPILFELKYI